MDKKEVKINKLTLKKVEREKEIGERIFGTASKVKSIEQTDNKNIQTQSQNPDIQSLQREIIELKTENRKIKASAALDKLGCIKTDLVIKALPDDCEDIQGWIDTFKEENEFLFKEYNSTHGGSYKPTQSTNLSPTEIMNNYIRGIM